MTSETTETTGPAETTVEERIKTYLLLREFLDRKKKQFDAQAVIVFARSRMAKLEGEFTEYLNALGKGSSLKTASGTVFLKTVYSASVSDPDEFMAFVIENRAWDLIERRANSTATQAFVKEHKHEPPGVSLNAKVNVNVRSPTVKRADD